MILPALTATGRKITCNSGRENADLSDAMTVSQAPSQKAYQSAQNKGYPMLIGMAVWHAASVGTKNESGILSASSNIKMLDSLADPINGTESMSMSSRALPDGT